jgi:hypothetical protein
MLTTKQMVRIDRAIGGKLMNAVTRAFASSEDKLHDLDVQIACDDPRLRVTVDFCRMIRIRRDSQS